MASKKQAKISFPNSRRGNLVILPTYSWICHICRKPICEFPCPFLTQEGFFDWEEYWGWWFNTVPSYDWKNRIKVA